MMLELMVLVSTSQLMLAVSASVQIFVGQHVLDQWLSLIHETHHEDSRLPYRDLK